MARDAAPPVLHNIEAEYSILGALLLNNARLDDLPAGFCEADFWDPVHGRVFAYVAAARAEGRTVTPITARIDMAGDAGLAELGGAAFLGLLADSTVGEWLRPHAEEVRRLAARRRLIEALESAAIAAADPAEDAAAITADLEARLHAFAPSGRMAARSIAEAVRERAEAVNHAFSTGEAPRFVASGLRDLDRVLCGGFGSEELVVIGGRPSMGKTAVAGVLARNAALAGHGVCIVSREMHDRQWVDRLVSCIASERGYRLPYKDMRAAHEFSEDAMRAWLEAADSLGRLPIRFAGSAAGTLGGVISEARRAARKFEADGKSLGLLVVDYLQLLAGEGRSENRNLDVARITGGLKAFALETGVPVVLLSQLSRNVESRADKRPSMADLRDSGGIEQDADVVAMVYRPEYYLQREKPEDGSDELAEWMAKMDAAAGRIELIVDKNRNGEVGRVDVHGDLAVNAVTTLHRGDGR